MTLAASTVILRSMMPHARSFCVALTAWSLVSPAAGAAPEAAATRPALEITGGPYLHGATPTSMTILWTTNHKCVSRVEYGPSADALTRVAKSARHGLVDANTTLHAITVGGLEPGTAWHYRVVSTEILEFRAYRVKFGATVEKEGRFTTLDPGKQGFSFCVINDRHDKVPGLRQALGSIDWKGVDMVVALGDVMNDPMTEDQIFRNFINPCAEFFAGRIPLLLVRGNHEARGALARELMMYFPTESGRYYYSFVHGGVHFLVLDGGEDKADSSNEYSGLVAFEDYVREETEWLRQELKSSAFREARFRVCLLHIPPVASRHGDADKFIRAPWIGENWIPLLSAAGLDLMLSGHTHRYAEMAPDTQRSFPIVVGGTNTVIRVDASPERLTMTTCNDDGSVLSRPPAVTRR